MVKLNLFTQIMKVINKNDFQKIVREKNTDKHGKTLTSWNHLVSMIFCQIGGCESLRDISNGLRSAGTHLNLVGMSSSPGKSGLSYRNQTRDWTLFRDFFFALKDKLEQVDPKKKMRFKIKSDILLLDSSIISLCLSVFDWAHYRTSKGGIKLHTLLNFETTLPEFIHVSDGKLADNMAAFEIEIKPNSVVVADRAYFDTQLLNHWDSSRIKFVVRAKTNIGVNVIKCFDINNELHPNILSDELVEFTGVETAKKYPKKVRKVKFWDPKNEKEITVFTNQLTWTAKTISELYKARWEIEKFFREIKQNLKIKSFVGTSFNAVMIQLWTAMIAILIIKYLKQIAKYRWPLSSLCFFIRLNLYAKIDLSKWLNDPFAPPPIEENRYVQGSIFKIEKRSP